MVGLKTKRRSVADKRQAEEHAVCALTELDVGVSATVCTLPAAKRLGQDLHDRGVSRGQRVVVERVAPWGDPLWVRFDDLRLLLRRDEAQPIRVQPLQDGQP